MANIKVNINKTIYNGYEIIFVAPCDCINTDGLSVYYPDPNGNTKNLQFVLKDAHKNNLSKTDLFVQGAYVKVILDTSSGIAYVQNPDTNKYLEAKFAEIEEKMNKLSVVKFVRWN